MTTKSKVIKRLKKQIKKLNARCAELSEEIKGLKDASETFAAQQLATESKGNSAQAARAGSKFSEEEVEMADEITDEAEEVVDLLDKSQ